MPQVRYAVVFNGGVSLAVWMGGVTHELNRIRLSSDALLASAAPRSEAWAAILEACGRSAVVDIIAGTSAGGLNGTLLATAVARGADLPDMRKEWSKMASLDVDKLTRRHTQGSTSILDGRYFKRKVRGIVGKIVARDDISPRDCTLLVTATALHSPPRHSYLDTGELIETRDGRRVYKFERKGPVSEPAVDAIDDFQPDGPAMPALVRAARASASFPVAFEPVWETSDLIEKRFVKGPDGGSWLVDGGVLDNAPFEPLLEVLRERETDEPFERVLLYITPGVGERHHRAQHVEPPALSIDRALGGVIGAVREPDERLDSDALDKIFTDMSYSKSQAYSVIHEYLTDSRGFDTEAFSAAAGTVFGRYCISRAEATERWLVSVSGAPVTLAPPAPPEEGPSHLPGMPSSFPAIEGGWQWGLAAADRILRWWGRALTSLSDPKASTFMETPESTALKTAMGKVAESQRSVTACWKLLEDAVSGTEEHTRDLPDQIAAMRTAYDQAPISMSRVLDTAMTRAAQAIAGLKPGVTVESLLKVSVSVEVLSGLFSWAGDDYDVPVFRYRRITPAAKVPSGITLTSPANGANWATKKLYGERLGHFGAFMNPDDRQHDWLWGRLDGASELSKQLLLGATELSDDEKDDLRRNLTAEILRSEGTDPDAVAEGANRVYQTDAKRMVGQMSGRDGGFALTQLDATVWELAKQLKTPGGVMRSLLAPDWNVDEVSSLGDPWPSGLHIARLGTGWLRPPIPKLIDRWLKKRSAPSIES